VIVSKNEKLMRNEVRLFGLNSIIFLYIFIIMPIIINPVRIDVCQICRVNVYFVLMFIMLNKVVEE